MNRVIVFGAAKNGLRLKRDLETNGYNVIGFCDNNVKKQRLELDGLEIISFENLKNLCVENQCDGIFLALLEPDEVINQLHKNQINVNIFGVTREYLSGKLEFSLDCIYPIDTSKPRLEYFEYHISYHCNLKCKGCGHFSNIAKPEFGNLSLYTNDIKRLKELFWGVKRIRLMGGEPLLNKELAEFIVVTRDTFKDANIRVVTNGLLIPNIPDELLRCMHTYNVGFDITQYIPTSEIKEKIELRCIEYGVEYVMSPLVQYFLKKRNKDGKSDINNSFEKCTSKKCHFLENGKLSVCGAPILRHKYDNELNNKIKFDNKDIIDIYNPELDGYIINDLLSRPIDACRYCNEESEYFEWEGNYPYLD